MAKAKKPKEGPALPADCFEVDGKTYRFIIKKFQLPGFGVLTALEAMTEPEVLAYLVKEKSSVIEEVV